MMTAKKQVKKINKNIERQAEERQEVRGEEEAAQEAEAPCSALHLRWNRDFLRRSCDSLLLLE